MLTRNETNRLLSLLAAFLVFGCLGSLAYFTRRIPPPEEVAFNKRFERDAVLVKHADQTGELQLRYH